MCWLASLPHQQAAHDAAFRRYEELLRPYIAAKQTSAERFAGFFAPKTQFGLLLRKYAIRAFRFQGLAKAMIGKDIVDKLKLPAYRFAK